MKKKIILSLLYFIGVYMAYFIIIASLTNNTFIHLTKIGLFTVAIIVLCKLLRVNVGGNLIRTRNNITRYISWILIGFSLAMVIQLIAMYIKNTFFGITNDPVSTEAITILIKENYLAIVSPLIIAPIFEELIFRKIIFTELYKAYPFWIAGSISALPFSLLHGDVFNIIVYFLVGMTFAYVYKKTNNLLVPIGMHLLLNSTPIIILFL